MRRTQPAVLLFLTCIWICQSSIAWCQSNKVPVSKIIDKLVNKSSLTQPGDHPFYLKAKLVDRKDPNSANNAVIEEYWLSPDKWRRTIQSKNFSQTLIVNGDKVFEQNSGDYYPPSMEQNVESMFAPMTPAAVELFKKYSMEIDEPSGRPGQCMSEHYFKDGYGKTQRVVLSTYCDTGLIMYVWVPGWDSGVYTDYKSFHGKMIARRSKDNEVNFEIDELRNLDNPDASMFAVAQSTNATNRIQTVHLDESVYHGYALHTPEPKWPQVSVRPDSGTAEVKIVVDRTGHVREAKCYVASNPQVTDAAAAEALHWQFKPYLVEGLPVQVQTTWTIPFKTTMNAAVADLPAAKTLFDDARLNQGLRLEGAKPFHLKASFEGWGNPEETGKGTYEETWLSPTQWKREITFNGHHVIESWDGDKDYRKFDGEYSSRRADEAAEALSFHFPGDGGKFVLESDWHVEHAKLYNIDAIRASSGYINPQGVPDTQTWIFYFAADNRLLRAKYYWGELSVLNDMVPFGKLEIPRQITVVQNGAKILQLQVNSLEDAGPEPASFFKIRGATTWSSKMEGDSFRMTPARLVKKVNAVVPHGENLHGKVICSVMIDEHGHVRGVEFDDNASDILDNAVRQAVMQWEFIPAEMMGHPSMTQQKFAFQF